MKIPDDGSGGYVQRCEKRRRAVALIVMCAPLGDARGQWQQRLSAIERLDLARLIHAQHHGPERRIHVQPHDVTYLLNE